MPLALFIVGCVSFLVAVACGGDDAKPATPAPTQEQAAATDTPTTTNTATPRPTSTSTPTPSPTPYNGAVRKLKIPKFNVDAPIEELAVNSRGELDTPHNENKDVAWYYIYDKPGRVNQDNLAGWSTFGQYKQPPAKGNAIFSGHIYYHDIPAPFVSLSRTAIGDDVSVVMEDGREYKYKVIQKNRYNRDTIDMGQVIWPKSKPEDKEWLTMITCGGALDSTGQEYVDRDVVIAERVE